MIGAGLLTLDEAVDIGTEQRTVGMLSLRSVIAKMAGDEAVDHVLWLSMLDGKMKLRDLSRSDTERLASALSMPLDAGIPPDGWPWWPS